MNLTTFRVLYTTQINTEAPYGITFTTTILISYDNAMLSISTGIVEYNYVMDMFSQEYSSDWRNTMLYTHILREEDFQILKYNAEKNITFVRLDNDGTIYTKAIEPGGHVASRSTAAKESELYIDGVPIKTKISEFDIPKVADSTLPKCKEIWGKNGG